MSQQRTGCSVFNFQGGKKCVEHDTFMYTYVHVCVCGLECVLVMSLRVLLMKEDY